MTQPAFPDIRISVVIPARNEAANLRLLADEVYAVLAPLGTFELIVIDDGSTDDTQSTLQAMAPSRPWLRLIRHERSAGQSAAIRTGIRGAKAATIATLDGDGQNDPRYLPDMIKILEQGPATLGLVQGQRQKRTDTPFKRWQSRLANGVRGRILRDGTRDSGCGLKVFRRDAYLALPYFDALHRFMPALFIREGYMLAHVDVVDRPRGAGQSNYSSFKRAKQAIYDLAGVWWLIRRRRPSPPIKVIL
jgi:dolichol-phosphate mannosyltransferase